MRLTMILAAIVLFVAPVDAFAQRPNGLKILGKYEGTVDKDKQPKLKTSFIATNKDWKRVWGTISPKGAMPKVDFSKHFLLVSSHDAADPNKRRVFASKDPKGVVKLLIASTRIGFRPSNRATFTFYKVERAGVTGINRYDRAKGKSVIDPLPKYQDEDS